MQSGRILVGTWTLRSFDFKGDEVFKGLGMIRGEVTLFLCTANERFLVLKWMVLEALSQPWKSWMGIVGRISHCQCVWLMVGWSWKCRGHRHRGQNTGCIFWGFVLFVAMWRHMSHGHVKACECARQGGLWSPFSCKGLKPPCSRTILIWETSYQQGRKCFSGRYTFLESLRLSIWVMKSHSLESQIIWKVETCTNVLGGKGRLQISALFCSGLPRLCQWEGTFSYKADSEVLMVLLVACLIDSLKL